MANFSEKTTSHAVGLELAEWGMTQRSIVTKSILPSRGNILLLSIRPLQRPMPQPLLADFLISEGSSQFPTEKYDANAATVCQQGLVFHA